MLVLATILRRQAMTAYEYLDLALSSQANAISLLSFGFAILCAYLIVAYVAGAKLTLNQVLAITFIYTVAVFFNLSAQIVAVIEASNYRQIANGMIDEINLRHWSRVAYLIIFIRLAIYSISLWFMWDIRHPKPE
jgi:hypothetical protein